jgi:hypothetical protein
LRSRRDRSSLGESGRYGRQRFQLILTVGRFICSEWSLYYYDRVD